MELQEEAAQFISCRLGFNIPICKKESDRGKKIVLSTI